MRLPKIARLAIRLAALVLFVLTAGLALSTPALAQAKPHPHQTSAAKSTTLPPPGNVQAVLQSDGSVDLSWKATAVPASKLGGYLVDRNNQQIAQLPTDGNGGPLTYVDPRPPVGTVTYSVSSYAPSGVAGQPSVGQTLNIRIASGSSGSNGSSDASPGDITVPNFRGHNAPTAFEEYGQFAGTVNETYGTFEDPFTRGLMVLLNVYWYFVTMHAYLALSFLAWGVTSRFYAPLAAVVSGVLTTFFHMPLWPTIISIVITATVVSLIPWILRGRRTQIAHGLGVMLGMLCLSVIGVAFNHTIVDTVMNSPVAAGDYILGQVDQIIPVNDNGSQYNLSTKPTFVGTPIDQEIRRFDNEEWLSTVYPSECMLNFGSVTWSTTHFVPNDVPLAAPGGGGVSSRFGPPPTATATGPSPAVKQGFNHLTYCEYLVRNNKFGGSESSYLKSEVAQNATGANSFVWDMYQGNDMPQHIWYAGLAMSVVTVRSIYIDVLALSFVVTEFLLAIALLKIGMLGIAYMWPPARKYVSGILKRTYVTWTIPIVGAFMAIICLALSNAAAHFMQQYGWTWSMLAQLFIALAVLFSFLGYWWRRHKEKKLRIRFDGTSTGGSGAVKAVAEGAAATAAIAATGGAAAPAIAAGGATAISSAAQPRAIAPAGSGPVPKQLPATNGGGSRSPRMITGTIVDGTPTTQNGGSSAVAPPANRRALPPGK